MGHLVARDHTSGHHHIICGYCGQHFGLLTMNEIFQLYNNFKEIMNDHEIIVN